MLQDPFTTSDVFSSNTAIMEADNPALVATKQDVENSLKRYFNVVRNVIADTKLSNDPTQDNFIKCKHSMFYVSWTRLTLHCLSVCRFDHLDGVVCPHWQW